MGGDSLVSEKYFELSNFWISFLVISDRILMDFFKEFSCLLSCSMLYIINKFTFNAIKYCNFKVKRVVSCNQQGVNL